MKRELLASLPIGLLLVAGCNAVLGLGDYAIGTDTVDAASDQTSAGDDAANDTAIGTDTSTQDAPAGCDAAEPTTATQCFGCTPGTNPEFLNACTASACVPFDDTTRLANWDGGALPPVPDPTDGGAG
jgi:hypothetical protein